MMCHAFKSVERYMGSIQESLVWKQMCPYNETHSITGKIKYNEFKSLVQKKEKKTPPP